MKSDFFFKSRIEKDSYTYFKKMICIRGNPFISPLNVKPKPVYVHIQASNTKLYISISISIYIWNIRVSYIYNKLKAPPCSENSSTPPMYVFWYHNDRMVNYDSGRGVRVETRAGEVEGRTVSRLSLPAAERADEGNYTCSPSNSEPATVHVFIQEGRGLVRGRSSFFFK